MYRQVLDLYATSADYNPKSAESVAFFKMVQNKFHYAMNRQTAAEIIYDRADSEKDSVIRNFRTTAADGKSYQTKYYNLDMIISLGYRITGGGDYWKVA